MLHLADGTVLGWISESGAPPPDDPHSISRAGRGLHRRLERGQHLLWTGSYAAGRRAVRRLGQRVRRPRIPDEAGARWRAQREHTGRVARLVGRLLVRIEPDGSVRLPGAPDTREAVHQAWGASELPRLVALRTLIGALSAAEWRRTGLKVPGLSGTLHPHYGVFSPTRNTYVQLVADLPEVKGRRVLDVGCGTGVLGFVLLQRGAAQLLACDLDPRAVDCARDNARRLGLDERCDVVQADLWPETRADLVLFNPPWMPETPRTRLDQAIFDPGARTLRRWLAGLGAHLTESGRGVLISSDLPERLGLRPPVEELVAAAGLQVVDRMEQPASHRQPPPRDALARSRAQERIARWQLRPR